MSEEIPETDLSGPLHPILAKENFQKYWRAAHPRFEPVFQIVSRLLTADHTLPFWHAIFFSPRVPRQGVSPHPNGLQQYPDVSVYEISPVTQLTPQQRADTLLKLDLLSHHIHFAVCPATPMLFEASTTYRAPHIAITIGDNTFHHILSQNHKSSPRKHQDNFLCASLLCHELAHAADILTAYLPPRVHRSRSREYDIEPFIVGQPLNELGYAWELAAFGGLPWDSCAHVELAGREVCHWIGGGSRSAMYRGLVDVDLATRRAAADAADNGGRSNLLTRIPIRWCYKFSTQAFWERTVPERGAAAFALPTNAPALIHLCMWADKRALRGYDDEYVGIGFGDVYHREHKLRFHYSRADIIARLGVGGH
jgi:hypothetical protein